MAQRRRGGEFLALVDDTTHRITLSLGLRCGLRSAEIVKATPADLATGPAGTMLRVPEGKGGKYRETSVLPELETTSRTVDDVRSAPSGSPLVDASTRTVRRWVERYADEAAGTYDDERWRDLSAHDFRRAWATLLAHAEEMDPLLVCQWSGWEDLETFLEHSHGAYSPEVQRRTASSGCEIQASDLLAKYL